MARDCIADLDATALRRVATQHLELLQTIDQGEAPRIVDKMPDNYLYLGLLAAMFPQATFIHCRRDLRDVAVSCWLTDFSSIRWADDPANLAARFHQYRRLMEHWRQVLPVPVLEVDYEQSVADLETVAQRLVACCGLPWEAACLAFHRGGRFARRAWFKCGCRFTRAPSDAGSNTSPTYRTCCRSCRCETAELDSALPLSA